MPKIIFYLIVILLASSCKETVSEIENVQEWQWDVTDSLPNKVSIDSKAQTILNDWKDFMALERSFDKIYSTENREDFVLIVDELVENQKKMEVGIYPTAFDIPQIKGRQQARQYICC